MSEDEVITERLRLDNSKSPGFDGIYVNLLKRSVVDDVYYRYLP